MTGMGKGKKMGDKYSVDRAEISQKVEELDTQDRRRTDKTDKDKFLIARQ